MLEPIVSPPPEVVKALSLSPFYKKYLEVGGFAIVSSEHVSDYALREAKYLVGRMLEGRQDILTALTNNQVRLAVMAYHEMTTQIPEHSDLTPAKYWDKRARGLGATSARPAVSCGEENLLNYPGDPYWSENILLHEFSHAVHEMGLSTIDPTFHERLDAAYQEALSGGLWKGTYASQNRAEYWAEGVQSWFDSNRENDSEHNHVNTREELKEYDPKLAALCEEVFGDKPWRYQHPKDRPKSEQAHLAGYQPETAPTFSWSKELSDWYDAYTKGTQSEGDTLQTLASRSDDPPPPSASTSKQTAIFFKNELGAAVRLYWIDFQGQKKLYATLQPGGSLSQSTYVGHTWLITDASDKRLALVVATEAPAKFLIGKTSK